MVLVTMSDAVSQRLGLPDPLIAIVGASDDAEKYGAKIYRDLKAKGYRVVGVSATRSTIDGDPAFKSVKDLPEIPDIINVVIPPHKTLELLNEIAELPDSAIWIQPGAADDAVRSRVKEMGIPALMDACIMVHSRSTVT